MHHEVKDLIIIGADCWAKVLDLGPIMSNTDGLADTPDKL
jgi:hypothetical protein